MKTQQVKKKKQKQKTLRINERCDFLAATNKLASGVVLEKQMGLVYERCSKHPLRRAENLTLEA